MKRLVCFFDGTWDKPDQQNVTNVVKLRRATLKSDPAGIAQQAHYEFGLGTEFSGRLSFLAGALSVGLGGRVRGAYRFLCESFEEGDEIYLFGFSRGAFEARSLAALIATVGLLRQGSLDRIGQAWRHYRRYRDKPQHAKPHRLLRSTRFPVPIRCVGVWDTVGTLGIPFLHQGQKSHVRTLPENVAVGLHALAIDEPRGAYRPMLWTRRRDAASPGAQIIEQAWFPGSHVDVGGGGAAHALSDAALLWMAERVGALTGLALDIDSLRATTAPDAQGEQCLPTTGLYRASRLVPYVRLIKQDLRGVRPLRRLFLRGWRTSRLPRDETSVNELVHESAARRLGNIVPMRRGKQLIMRRYRPRSLTAVLAPVGVAADAPVAARSPGERTMREPLPALAGWALFEWATQPFYTLIVTFLFGPYFVNHFVGDAVRGQSLWAYSAEPPACSSRSAARSSGRSSMSRAGRNGAWACWCWPSPRRWPCCGWPNRARAPRPSRW